MTTTATDLAALAAEYRQAKAAVFRLRLQTVGVKVRDLPAPRRREYLNAVARRFRLGLQLIGAGAVGAV